jgi:hypothetical protein
VAHRWETREPVDNDEQHILPVDDVIAHQPDDCPCGPATEAVPRDDGSFGWLVTHHSLDGRELAEPDYAGPRPPEG